MACKQALIPDSPTANTLGTILINEFLAHTDPPQLDFIELYNYGNTSINLASCILTDDPETNKFIVPNISIGPRAFVVQRASRSPPATRA